MSSLGGGAGERDEPKERNAERNGERKVERKGKKEEGEEEEFIAPHTMDAVDFDEHNSILSWPAQVPRLATNASANVSYCARESLDYYPNLQSSASSPAPLLSSGHEEKPSEVHDVHPIVSDKIRFPRFDERGFPELKSDEKLDKMALMHLQDNDRYQVSMSEIVDAPGVTTTGSASWGPANYKLSSVGLFMRFNHKDNMILRFDCFTRFDMWLEVAIPLTALGVDVGVDEIQYGIPVKCEAKGVFVNAIQSAVTAQVIVLRDVRVGSKDDNGMVSRTVQITVSGKRRDPSHGPPANHMIQVTIPFLLPAVQSMKQTASGSSQTFNFSF